MTDGLRWLSRKVPRELDDGGGLTLVGKSRLIADARLPKVNIRQVAKLTLVIFNRLTTRLAAPSSRCTRKPIGCYPNRRGQRLTTTDIERLPSWYSD
jgi:hypothetical protein